MQIIRGRFPQEVDSPSTIYMRMNRIYREANLVTGATGPTPAQPSRETTPPSSRPKISTPEEIYRLMNSRYDRASRGEEGACD